METILELIVGVLVLAFVGKVLWEKFNSHPSDKYHNDSWTNRNK